MFYHRDKGKMLFYLLLEESKGRKYTLIDHYRSTIEIYGNIRARD